MAKPKVEEVKEEKNKVKQSIFDNDDDEDFKAQMGSGEQNDDFFGNQKLTSGSRAIASTIAQGHGMIDAFQFAESKPSLKRKQRKTIMPDAVFDD